MSDHAVYRICDAFPCPPRCRLLRHPNPWDIGSARLLGETRFHGARDDQFRLRVVDRPPGQPHHAGRCAGARAGDRVERGRAGERRLRGRLRHRPRRCRRQRRACRRHRHCGTVDRGRDRRPERSAVRRSRSLSSAYRGAPRDRPGGSAVLLTARSEGFIVGRPDLAETLRRLTAYAEAGADCLYAPGIRTPNRSRPWSRRWRPGR